MFLYGCGFRAWLCMRFRFFAFFFYFMIIEIDLHTDSILIRKFYVFVNNTKGGREERAKFDYICHRKIFDYLWILYFTHWKFVILEPRIYNTFLLISVFNILFRSISISFDSISFFFFFMRKKIHRIWNISYWSSSSHRHSLHGPHCHR